MDTIEIIVEELNKKGVKPSQMMSELGFSNGLFSQWKSGLQKPSSTKLEKIAEYLDCSVDYLLGKTTVRIRPESLTEEEQEFILLLKERDPDFRKSYLELLKASKK